MAPEKVKVGIIGCGNISPFYLDHMTKDFRILEVVACADIIPERAATREAEYPGVEAMTNDELFNHPDIEIVVNLTPPAAHAEIAFGAVAAGKSVQTEKPLAITREDAQKLLKNAKAKGVRVGAAPDTFLGGGLQTCRKLIDDGWIGTPIAASAFMMGYGPEGWHPDPDFFYKTGAGPLFDVGPYYVTALIALLGPVKRITSSARITRSERLITSRPHYGEKIKVEVPTHVAGVMDFASGAVGTIITSFDIIGSTLPRIEIYGTEGALVCPDPNTFSGPVKVVRAGGEIAEAPLSHGYTGRHRGIGVADMAYALRSGRPHRCSAEMAYHALDCMHAFYDASDSEKHVKLQSTCDRPAPLPLGLRDGVLDE